MNYGRTKLAGEQLVQLFTWITISSVRSKRSANLATILLFIRCLAETYPILTVVSFDQVGRPTWTRTLAEFMVHVMETKPANRYLSSIEWTTAGSWYEFACEILKDFDVEVEAGHVRRVSTKAYRPKHSVMDLSKS